MSDTLFYVDSLCILIFYQGKERRTIRQFPFTAWPDKGVPAYASSLVHFHSKVIHTPGTLKGPMIVHCRYANNLTDCQVKVLFTCPEGLNYFYWSLLYSLSLPSAASGFF